MITPGDKLLGARLRRAREAAGLSQAAVASAIGRSRSSVTNMESGRNPPGREALRRLAKVYGLSMDNLNRPPDTPTEVETEEEGLLLRAFRTMPKTERAVVLKLVVGGALKPTN